MQQVPTKYIKITLLLVSTMTIMAGAIIAPSLPQIKKAYIDLPQAELLSQLVLTVPGFFIALGAPIVGYIIDKIGRKKVLIFSLVLYGLAGTAGFYLNDLYLILVSRAILGLAVAGIMTITNTLTADYFQGEERNRFVGIRGSFVAFGGVIFVGASGFLADISWRIPFLVYFFAFLMLPLVVFYLYEPNIERQTMEKLSNSNHPSYEPDYPRSWIRFVYFIAFIGMTLFYLIPVNMPFYLNEILGVSNSLVGISIGTAMLSGAIASLNYGRIKRQLNFNAIYSLCFGAMGIGFLIISQASSFTGAYAYPVVISGLIINGFGIGLIGPNHALCLMNSSPEYMRGRILGTLTTFVFMGQFSSPFVSKLAIAINHSLPFTFEVYGILLFAISCSFLAGSLDLKKVFS